ncbi:MAG: efflux RND transporter permease subunit, partial [Gammaproteobacteria bacterium]|nr:efflux RND transporter permease subunit [Gammaproteobacteria bacterium]NNM14536.1 efflux RND transporter permease subunit [Gammaproteobacteria bacterium]
MAHNYHDTSPFNPIRWFLDNPIAVNILMFSIILGGLFSLDNMQRRVMPDVSIDFFVIHVPVNSGSAEDVERTIVSKIEEEVSGIEGVESYNSTSTANLGSVAVEVAKGYNKNKVRNDVMTRVDAISTFPRDAEEPYVFDIDGNSEIFGGTVIQINLSGQRSTAQLSDLAEELRAQLLEQEDITSVDIDGIPTEEISIELSEETLRAYQINMDTVVNAIRSYSVDRSGGTLKQDSGFMQLRVRKERRNGEDFANIPILSLANGQQVLLRDIAVIKDSYTESLNISKFNGNPSVGVLVKSTEVQDIIKIKTAALGVLDKYQKNLSPDIAVTTWLDETITLQDRLDLVKKNGLLGLALVLILLGLFLDLRLAMWVAVGIPIAFLGAILLMPSAGTSFNYVSTFGFIVALGIVVDDAIIVSESVHRSVETKGPGLASVFEGTSKVAIPTTFGVLTTMAAFLPLILLDGVFGDILGEMGTVVMLCFLFSLIESKLILPSHLRHLKPSRQYAQGERINPIRKIQNVISKGLGKLVNDFYMPLIRKVLKARYITLGVFIAALILAMSMVGNQVQVAFFPDLEDNRMRGSIEMLEGTPYEVTFDVLDRLENSLEQAVQEFTGRSLEDVSVQDIVKNIAYVSNGDKTLNFRAELDKYQGKEISPAAFSKIWQKQFGSPSGVKVVSIGADGGPTSSDVEIILESRDLEDLKQATAIVETELRKYNEVVDTSNNLISGQNELQFTTNALAQSMGLNEAEIIRQVRQAIYGAEVQRIQRGREETRVFVRYPANERQDISILDNLRIRTQQGQEVPLSALVNSELAPGVTQIIRVDGKRAVKITASVINKVALGKMQDVFLNNANAYFADLPGVDYRLDGQAEEQRKTVGSLISGLMISVILIFTLLALPLNSYAKPLIIVSVIPFSLIGVILGHFITGYYMSLPSFLGALALFGVVINDSLVLTTTINYHQDRGRNLLEAIEVSVRERFRPILLTSITTYAGLAPLLLENSLAAEFLKPMAISLAYGILFATMITLILVPVIFRILADIR